MDNFSELIKKYKILKEELKNNYQENIIKIINSLELKPIKKELLFIIKNIEFNDLDEFISLVNVLFMLYKEKKLDFINQEFLDFLKSLNKKVEIPDIIFALTYSNKRLTKNLLSNIQKINYLNESLSAIYKLLIVDYNKINYIHKVNNDYCNIVLKNIHLKDKLDVKNYALNDYYILNSILNWVSIMVYINIYDYDYNYDLIETVMNEIESNILSYFMYFNQENLWNFSDLLKENTFFESGREFIVVGNIVNEVYNKERIKKFEKRYYEL